MAAPEMSLRRPENRRLCIILTVIAGIGIGLCFVKFPVGMGLLAGELLSVIIYEWNVYYWNRVLDSRHAGTFTGFPHFLINFVLMGGLLLTCVYNPSILNIFSASAGLMSVKSAIIVNELLKGKGGVK